MPLPAAAVAAVVVGGGAALGVASGYVIDKVLGDGHYTGREMAVDATMGAIPGMGLVRPTAKILASGRHIRHFDRAQGDRLVDIPLALAFVNRRNFTQIGKTIATEKVVDYMAGYVFDESGRSSPSSFQQGGGRSGNPKGSRMRKVTWNRSKKGGKFIPSCPSGYKLRRVGKRLMCVKS